MKKPVITVIGSNNVDLVTYIDRLPHEGETITASRFEMGFGGKGANQAVAAALLGAEVHMVSRIGGDLFGPSTKRNLERFGIDTSYVEEVSGVSTGVAPIFVDSRSNNRILVVKGANDCLKPVDVEKAKQVIAGSDIVIVQLEIPLETVYHAIGLARACHVPVILNPAPAETQLDFDQIADVSILMPNESELATLSGMPVGNVEEAKAAGRAILDRGVDRVIVTLGPKGSLLLTRYAEVVVPPLSVESRDSTGAGDAFIGCLATYYVKTGDLRTAMEMANRYAAASTLTAGTQKSFLNQEQFEESYSSR